MTRKYLLPAIALIGAIIALFVVFWSQKKAPVPPIPFTPARSPYAHYVAGEGIVEASSRNISIGSPFSQIITKVHVVEGDAVETGDLLFQLDTRFFEAQAETARGQIRAALVNLENQQVQFSFYERLKDKRAVSEQQYEQSYYAVREAEEQLRIAEGQLAQAEANIEMSYVRAPIRGEILQVNVHAGEVAPNVVPISSQGIIPYGSVQYPLMLMGKIEPFSLRIDIDEEDAWRYQKGARATAFVRGNSSMHFPLQFERIEPYIIPKASFTGQIIERIDTRVLQVLYRFQSNLPIYAGQILDVFLEAPALAKEKPNAK
ncbi:MAG TPA: biotin/lipoyl-binding protein [Rhabdochlamydiaceae bacterium]|jgi:biotin carboxyl carrier protein